MQKLEHHCPPAAKSGKEGLPAFIIIVFPCPSASASTAKLRPGDQAVLSIGQLLMHVFLKARVRIGSISLR